MVVGIDAIAARFDNQGEEVALLPAGIAPATASAAIADVVRETKANGPLSRTLPGVVLTRWALIRAGESSIGASDREQSREDCVGRGCLGLPGASSGVV